MTAVTVVRQPEDKRKILNFQLEMFDNWGGMCPKFLSAKKRIPIFHLFVFSYQADIYNPHSIKNKGIFR